MAVRILPWDPAEHISSDEDMAEYLEAALELAQDEDDPGAIAHMLGAIARAKGGMSVLADATGLSRENLYRALSGRHDPKLSTVVKVINALGLRLHAHPAGVRPEHSRSPEPAAADRARDRRAAPGSA